MDEMNTPPPSPTVEPSLEQHHFSPSAPSPGHTQASPAPIRDSRCPNHGYDAPTVGINSEIDEVRIAAQFIDELKSATLEESNMELDDISRLREASPELPFDLDDPDFLFALRPFFATTNASEETYKSFLFAYKECHPSLQQYSFYQMKKYVEHLSGVVPLAHDMCIDTCAAFTGPFKDLEECYYCTKPRYENGRPRRQFYTIPVGPIIQALYASPASAKNMQHRTEATQRILEYMDYSVCGSDHPDITFSDLHRFRQGIDVWYNDGIKKLAGARNMAQYQAIRLETGLCRPTIFSGLRHSLGVPQMFVMDIMHLVSINDPDLLLGLWRGTLQHYAPDKKEDWEWFVLKGKIWKAHGETVARANAISPFII